MDPSCIFVFVFFSFLHMYLTFGYFHKAKKTLVLASEISYPDGSLLLVGIKNEGIVVALKQEQARKCRTTKENAVFILH